ncbi:DNA polymerase III subunit delta [Papillibacter cinnamivorans]|uniref:DNA polymerase III subunit delta n=1 Tax=Papillibacter cinnamivorans DSM 12816 TaxID=1122930 RepID=A0A1W1ZI98_9FIRM|nr:DNA polymerase III subunit delta [Papillibacter cinnamivorans]SMC47791.1 DNA polymerase III, delta subunit [Papillibacter cinnamivorans DSM 12816]
MAKTGADQAGYRRLRRAVSDGDIGKLYVFYGEEDYLRDFCLGEMKKALVEPGMEEFNFRRLQGKNLTLRELNEAVDTFPMGAGKTFVTVSDYDLFKAGEQKEELAAFLSDLPDTCCLVFLYDTLEYKPDARLKLTKTIREKGETVQFSRQEQSDLVSWIRRRFKAMDKEIDGKRAEYLIFLCGGLMTGLVSEIEKVGAYAKGRTITKEDIDAVATPVLDAVAFQMTDAMAERDFDKAAGILGTLLKMQEPPVRLLAVIGRQMRQLYSARLALDTGRDASKLMELWGMRSSYPAQLLLRSAGRFSTPWCRKAVRLCCEADLAMKSSFGDSEDILKLLILRLAQKEAEA